MDRLPLLFPGLSDVSYDTQYSIRIDDLGTHGSDGYAGMSVDIGGRMFKRRAIKGIGGGNPQRVTWLVGELNGVRAYLVHNDGRVHVVLTTQDINP
jgi:hypothetical protein